MGKRAVGSSITRMKEITNIFKKISAKNDEKEDSEKRGEGNYVL